MPDPADRTRDIEAEAEWQREDDRSSKVPDREQHPDDSPTKLHHQWSSTGEQPPQQPAQPAQAGDAAAKGQKQVLGQNTFFPFFFPVDMS